jgi:hypothetical protein
VARKVISWYISLKIRQNTHKILMDSEMLMMYSTALGIDQWARKTKAMRLQEESLSAMRKAYMSSAASNIRFSNAVDRIQGKNCVFAGVGMSMFEACAACRYQWFQQFSILGDFL